MPLGSTETLYGKIDNRNALYKALSEYSKKNSGTAHEGFLSQHKTVSELILRMKKFANIENLLSIVERVESNNGGIIVVSDYDADGICSMTEFCDFMELIGVDYVPFIPDREDDGYGISLKILPKLSALGLGDGHFQTVVCLDNGVNRTDVRDSLRELGIEMLVIDHHTEDILVSGTDNQTDFQLNPHLSQNKEIFAEEINVNTGVLVYGFCLAYLIKKGYSETAKIFADLERDMMFVSIIGDSMPMRGLNKAIISSLRTFFFTGEGVRESLREIIDEYRDTPFLSCDWNDPSANGVEEFVAWTLVPRLNSVGRLSDAMDAVRFLRGQGVDRDTVERINAVRKSLTEYLKKEIRAIAADDSNIGKRTFVHVGTKGSSMRSGVRSVLAGHFSEKLGKPVAFGVDSGDGVLKLSLRSPYPIDFRELFAGKYQFSGHKEAGVVSVPSYEIKEFVAYFENIVGNSGTGVIAKKAFCELPDKMVSLPTDFVVKTLGPWGKGNPEPSFLICGRSKPFSDVKAKRTSGGRQKIRFIMEGGLELTAYNWGADISEDDIARCTGLIGKIRSPFGGRTRTPAFILDSVVLAS